MQRQLLTSAGFICKLHQEAQETCLAGVMQVPLGSCFQVLLDISSSSLLSVAACPLQVLTITVPAEQVAAAQQMVLECLSPRAQLTYSVGGTLKFELPSSEVSLAAWQLSRRCTPCTLTSACRAHGLSVLLE